MLGKPNLKKKKIFNPRCLITQKWENENENSLTLKMLHKPNFRKKEISLTLDRCLITKPKMRKWKMKTL
jgi:hypothetical protein